MSNKLPLIHVRDLSCFLLIGSFITIFFGAAAIEKSGSHLLLLFFLIFAFFLVTGLYFSFLKIMHKEFILRQSWHYILGAGVGAVTTFLLSTQLHLTTVISAATVGVIAGYLCPLFPSTKMKELAPSLYCGAFVGMTAATRISNPIFIFTAGLIAGAIFTVSQNIFTGHGGKLGSIAFVGSAVTILLLGALHVH